MGVVPNVLSSQRPMNRPAKITTSVRQPTSPTMTTRSVYTMPRGFLFDCAMPHDYNNKENARQRKAVVTVIRLAAALAETSYQGAKMTPTTMIPTTRITSASM